jgi:hypothetical protein
VIPLAHGVSVRTDLPIPLALALIGSGAAVVVSFLVLLLAWRRSRLRGDTAGAPLPAGLQAVLDSPVFRWVLRLVVLVVTLVVVVVALTGSTDPPQNLAPYAFYVTFWVGLVPASLLLGPVWRVVNPLRTLYVVLRLLTGPPPSEGRTARLGMWPAAVSLLAFTWLELCYPERATPSTVGVFLVVYGVIHLVCALWFGEEWFAQADGFEVYSTLLGRLSVLGRREDGRLVLRNPLDGLDGLAPARGLAGVVVVLLGGTAFDGVTRTSWWQNGPGLQGDAVTAPQTLWLGLTVLAVGGLYLGATALAGRVSGVTDAPALLAHSLVPIAAGYAIAHYFSLLLIEGQLTWILGSDPFRQGWDLFGKAKDSIDYLAVSPDAVANVQVGAIVLGHVIGVVLAHDRWVRLAKGRRELVAQLPLLVVMVGFTVGGIGLLLGA